MRSNGSDFKRRLVKASFSLQTFPGGALAGLGPVGADESWSLSQCPPTPRWHSLLIKKGAYCVRLRHTQEPDLFWSERCCLCLTRTSQGPRQKADSTSGALGGGLAVCISRCPAGEAEAQRADWSGPVGSLRITRSPWKR